MLEKCKKKKKKGQTVGGIGTVILMFVLIVVGIALVTPVFQTQGTMTDSITLTNATYTSPANGATIDLIGQSLLSTPVVHNATDGAIVPATNYTIAEGVSTSTGVKTIQLTVDDATWASKSVNVSYVYGADGYIDSAGGRAIADNIGLFAVLALVAGVLFYFVRENGWMLGI